MTQEQEAEEMPTREMMTHFEAPTADNKQHALLILSAT